MFISLIAAVALSASPASFQGKQLNWYKGNLHTHTLWSDGNDYPEMVADWYKSQGYHFLALSDHNVVSDNAMRKSERRWFNLNGSRGAGTPLANYIKRFGDDWVVTRVKDGVVQVRLRTLPEFRGLLEEPERFLMIQSEEITAGKNIHVNATNIQEFIAPFNGETALETMQKNIDAVNEQRERLGVPMFPHVNHPNFVWAVTAEELMQLNGEKFFEVYNGHPAVNNYGDTHHAGMERMWDIILTMRLAELGLPVMYGIAVDDAHHYFDFQISRSNPGRAWVMVRASSLSAEAIVEAMERGDFYGSTGVTLRDISSAGNELRIEIEPEEGVEYQTVFIGTRQGVDTSSEPVLDEEGEPLGVTRQYSDNIGEVLAVVEGTSATYKFDGDEIYVRARVESTKPKLNPYREGETETAWVQPVVNN